MRYKEKTTLTFKKKHACGSFEWEVLSSGADVRLECLGCKRRITLLPSEIDKRIKIKKSLKNFE